MEKKIYSSCGIEACLFLNILSTFGFLIEIPPFDPKADRPRLVQSYLVLDFLY